ncbi:hypothetical protein OTERR_12970 [Oryzomicrobium terrae]|uniref:Uncharacterized protein n=1 Tax=Oryzomicrobium terrae TaxID=1735038 RepID=A0A5C1E7D6_9RHOO|nr:hypothetical protein [Oryzomicrobium terrae]QEL64773.1 hypothetical protein OTERR_12970 [Oryzomicrobium terrae]
MSVAAAGFGKAIQVAEESARELLPGLSDLKLEGVVISGKDYEVTLSYYISGQSPLELSQRSKKETLGLLAAMMTSRREYKVFLVDKNTFAFRGFRAYKE